VVNRVRNLQAQSVDTLSHLRCRPHLLGDGPGRKWLGQDFAVANGRANRVSRWKGHTDMRVFDRCAESRLRDRPLAWTRLQACIRAHAGARRDDFPQMLYCTRRTPLIVRAISRKISTTWSPLLAI
jgi:hypothetical protein